VSVRRIETRWNGCRSNLIYVDSINTEISVLNINLSALRSLQEDTERNAQIPVFE
jgi:hypothetical protein